VENRSEITEFTNSSFGSRLPEPKRQQAAAVQGGKFLAKSGLSFYRGDKKKRATLPSSSLSGFSSSLRWHSVSAKGKKMSGQKNEMM
jgi:hypothetical protein